MLTLEQENARCSILDSSSALFGFSRAGDLWMRESGCPNLESVFPGLNSFDLVMRVGADRPEYGSEFPFAASLARELIGLF